MPSLPACPIARGDVGARNQKGEIQPDKESPEMDTPRTNGHARRRTAEREARVEELLAKAKAAGTLDERVQLDVLGGNDNDVLRGAIEALKSLKPALYQRSGGLVRVIPDLQVKAGTDEHGNARSTIIPAVVKVEAPWLKPRLLDVINFRKWNRKGTNVYSISPPGGLAEQILSSSGDWPYPPLAGVVSTPTMRPDGTLLLQEGYDAATGLYLMGAPAMPKVKDKPTRKDALEALTRLNDELLVGFPFEDEPSRSVALSALMTPVLRAAFLHAPLHAVTAPASRTGKSFFLDIVATVVVGNVMPVVDFAERRDGEFDKMLAALLMQGVMLVNIDNVESPLGGAFLCQVLTQSAPGSRILGMSKVVYSPTTSTTFFANGNNLEIKGDVAERVIVLRMNANMERPSERTFKANPRAAAAARREEYLAAILTIARAYVVAGRPGVQTMNGFEGWSHTVRSALVWLGCADPCLTTATATQEDPKAEERRTVLAAIADTIGTGVPFQARTLIAWPGLHNERLSDKQEACRAQLHAALMTVAGDGNGINNDRLGGWFRRNKKIIAGKLKLVKEGELGGSTQWKLEKWEPQAGDGEPVAAPRGTF